MHHTPRLPNIMPNIQGTFKRKQDARTARGENEPIWTDIADIWGILDFQDEQTERISYKGKMEQSTHVFYCDYFPLEYPVHELKFICRGKEYDILLIDDVQFWGVHYEIALKLVTP
ncbi:MAG: head-tail adaptor protein [Turicibacter sp.]|nr:head-tail adaptor protein [Turicibacter sp.]